MSVTKSLCSGMRLSEKLTNWLEATGCSDTELARRLKVVSNVTVGRWKEGLRDPRRREVVRLAEVTGLPIAYWADDGLDAPPGPAISDDEWKILELVRELGIAESRRRLIQAPGPAHLTRGVNYGDPVPGVGGNRRA